MTTRPCLYMDSLCWQCIYRKRAFQRNSGSNALLALAIEAGANKEQTNIILLLPLLFLHSRIFKNIRHKLSFYLSSVFGAEHLGDSSMVPNYES